MDTETINRRIVLMIVVFGTMLSILSLRLFYIQIVRHQHLSQLALKQQERTIEIQPTRGSIFDRQGRPLALNRQVTSFYAVPGEVKHPRKAARKLAELLGVSPKRMVKRFQSKRAFVWIKRKVSDQQAKRVMDMKLSGIRALKETTRVYPEGSLASHVLGFVGLDNQGLAGVELAYDRKIKGQNGWIRISRDAKGRKVPTSTRIHKASEPGKDVYLTIDKVVQHIAERALEKGLEKSKAKHGSIIVMDPKTGEILAMANKPDFDPNHFGRYSAANRRNRAILDVYEPGSTFKIVTAAAGLEEGLFQEDDIIDCENGKGVFDNRIVRDHEPRGRLTFHDVMVYSSNVGAVKIGMRLGGEKLYSYTRNFGFGRVTGLGLPGESRGLLKPMKHWKDWRDISTTFGQSVAVTSLQMASAFSTVANNGRLIQPWIVKSLNGQDGSVYEKGKPVVKRQVISAQTAKRMRAILGDVVVRGTGMDAAITNYEVAGKTGTAQKPRKNGRGYDSYYHVASFMGCFPKEDPKLLISVVIDSPKGFQWGGMIAGPIFSEVGRQLVAYLGIPPGPKKVYSFAESDGKNEPQKLGGLVEVPHIMGQDVKISKKAVRELGLKPICLGKGKYVAGQRPAPGSYINRHTRVVLYLDKSETTLGSTKQYNEVIVPNVSGQSMRNAIQILNSYGLEANVRGSGVVKQQKPEAYARVHVGNSCKIECVDPEKEQ